MSRAEIGDSGRRGFRCVEKSLPVLLLALFVMGYESIRIVSEAFRDLVTYLSDTLDLLISSVNGSFGALTHHCLVGSSAQIGGASLPANLLQDLIE